MGSPVKAREWEKTLKVKCRLCGGARCKRCSESAALAKTDSPVRGLHADWVADCALAMMRPSSRLMANYQIAQQFHKLNITAVFNLTLPGEHPYCGDGLVASGFPYDPETDLMAENIRFYNFGWEDMTTPTLPFMLDIVKVIASVLLTGHHKVAVHCHAGYGRTGLVIACALIFLHNIPPELAIRLVRRDRPGSVQTAAQAQFVRDFHGYLNAARVVFALPEVHDRFSLAETVEHQNRRLYGEARAAQSTVPRVLDFLCVEFERRAAAVTDVAAVVAAFVSHLSVRQQEAWPPTIDSTKELSRATPSVPAELLERHLQIVVDAVVEGSGLAALLESGRSMTVAREELFPIKVAFNVGEWNWSEAAALCQNRAAVHAALLLDWLEHLREPLLNSQLVDKLLHIAPVPPLKLTPASKAPTHEIAAGALHHGLSMSSRGVEAEGGGASPFQFQALHQLPAFAMRSLDRVLSCLRVLQTRLLLVEAEETVLFDAVCVRAAMALFHLPTAAARTPSVSLRRHADCVALLVRRWHAPKRLELNLESLQKLGGQSSSPPAGRRLSQSNSSITLGSESATPASIDVTPSHSPTRSPTRHPREATLSLPATGSSLESVTSSKPSSEASAPVITTPLASAPSSRSSSPVKIEPLPSMCSRPLDNEGDGASVPFPSLPLTPSSSPKKKNSEAKSPSHPADEDDSSSVTLSLPKELESSPMAPHSSSMVSLPSVRDGDRYSRRTGSAIH